MDHITIKRLEVFGNHGVLQEENRLGQKFVVSVDMELSTRKAGCSDSLEDSIDYGEVAELIHRETKRHIFQLVERLAEHLAEQILRMFPAVRAVTLEVEKPWAPIQLPLQTVSVTIYRAWHEVCLGLGSNMGDKRANLDKALERLAEDAQSQLLAVSDYIETEPVGEVEQDNFLNGAVLLRTLKTPEEIMEQIHGIETELKRERTVHWGPRTIDVDILLYDREIIIQDNLTIPHPQMCDRGFVLEPLYQIAPDWIHPVHNKTVRELYEEWMNTKKH